MKTLAVLLRCDTEITDNTEYKLYMRGWIDYCPHHTVSLPDSIMSSSLCIKFAICSIWTQLDVQMEQISWNLRSLLLTTFVRESFTRKSSEEGLVYETSAKVILMVSYNNK